MYTAACNASIPYRNQLLIFLLLFFGFCPCNMKTSFFKDLFLFIGKVDIQRGGEKERKIFHLIFSLPNQPQQMELSQSEARSQELLLGLPHGCRDPKPWAILYCFNRLQAGSWMGSGAAGIRPGAHMGSQCIQGEDFNHYAIVLSLSESFRFVYISDDGWLFLIGNRKHSDK